MKTKLELTRRELIAYLRLFRTQSIGATTFFAFLKIYKTPERALLALPEMVKHSKKPVKIFSDKDAENELNMLEKIGAKMIVYCEAAYPKMLLSIPDPPPIITVLGDTSLLTKQMIAIIGGRNASLNGMNFAMKLAQDLTEAGFITVSGFARGIDAAVHKISLKGMPSVAVMGSGIDIIYPSENSNLYKSIIDNGGLIMTEFPFNAQPKRQFFPQRNRIISGLAHSVVVIEASKRSGSLITANFALAQNREVLAVPGSPLDDRCSGSNLLIQNGAKLIQSAEDVIDSIRFENKAFGEQSLFDNETDEYNHLSYIPSSKEVQFAKERIFHLLDLTPIDIDQIIIELQVHTEVVLIALLELELSQKIKWYPNNRVSRLLDSRN